MAHHYNHGLVFVSMLVAILASYTALTLALRIRHASREAAPAWLVGGGLAMGLGIWCMHFVGMLALRLQIEIAYDLATTLLSLLIAVVVSTFALHIASRERVSSPSLAAAGIAMGVGISAMHYVGMAAIQMSPPIRYDAAWVTLSFAIAIAASFAALGVAFSPHADSGLWRYRRALGGVVMGIAISGMHYAGMIAAKFPVGAVTTATAVDKAWLAGSVATITLFVLAATLLLSLIESRAKAHAAVMQASLAEAKQDSRAKDEFLAMLGHELRNPLAAIANAAHLLELSESRGVDSRLARDVIARQTRYLGAIVDDLLDVGGAIAGKLQLQRGPLELHAAVEQALQAQRTSGKTTGRRVDCIGTPLWVHADRTRIEQLVSNLVSNAVQHTGEGGNIRVRVERDAREAVLTVSDDGTGMDAETVARAFELFYQGPQEADRRRGGLGIGLTLARRVVELHGGSIIASSGGPGMGATFTVRLPAAELPQAQAQVRARPAGAIRRVVLVEDAADARETLRMVLESEGHSVHVEADGPGGLDAILRLRPDVALIDIGLPGLDGYLLAERTRRAGLGTFLVALTGYGLVEDRQRAQDVGFDAHLRKPAPMAQLLRLVADASSSPTTRDSSSTLVSRSAP